MVIDTIQYMLGLYPDIINTPNEEGCFPIHKVAQGKRADLVELLLKHDPGAVSRTFASRHQNNSTITSYNFLLHWACDVYNSDGHMEVVEVLFDAYPQAIDIHNGTGKTPFDLARERVVHR